MSYREENGQVVCGSQSVVWWDYLDFPLEDCLEFRLTYEGQLLGSI